MLSRASVTSRSVERYATNRGSEKDVIILLALDAEEEPSPSQGHEIKKKVSQQVQDANRSKSGSKKFDPFQIFKVRRRTCQVLKVLIRSGEGVSKGKFRDLLDKPNPYIVLKLVDTPNRRKCTRVVKNSGHPVWDEKFAFVVNPDTDKLLEINLMDSNIMFDMPTGRATLDFTNLKIGEKRELHIILSNGASVYLSLRRDRTNPDLRFSLALSDEEKSFLAVRRRRVFEALCYLLDPKDQPLDPKHAPCISILGSGGGFRAMIAFSGSLKALDMSGVLGCTSFIATLSGSSWYLAYLYSHPEFPDCGALVLQQELREKTGRSWLKLLTPAGLKRYVNLVTRKSTCGQPVSFTDFFGHLVADTLLGERKTTRLSSQRAKVEEGQLPMPLYTCLHVKKDVLAKVFQEWIEFTPFEVGFAKYGTFMKPEHFGSKFYMGKVLRLFEEYPLHYLMGIWGSAFTVLLKKLLYAHDFTPVMGPHIRHGVPQLTATEEMEYRERLLDELLLLPENGGSENGGARINEEDLEGPEKSPSTRSPFTPGSERTSVLHTYPPAKQSKAPSSGTARAKSTCMWQETREKLGQVSQAEPTHHHSVWERALDNLFNSEILDTRVGRSGMILNPMLGLDMKRAYPVSPFDLPDSTNREDEADFLGAYEKLDLTANKLFLADAGLTFNLPFPLVVRPQRAVDIHICFDFSYRPTDDSSPFVEILLVEKWAQINRVPFPNISKHVEAFLREPLQEIYIFEEPDDPIIPVIIFFVLHNKEFRSFKEPGVPRTTEEERQFADFDLFNDPNGPYATHNFTYTPLQFNRIAMLAEFNVLNNLHVIRETIARVSRRKLIGGYRPPINLHNVSQLAVEEDEIEQLEKFIKNMAEEWSDVYNFKDVVDGSDTTKEEGNSMS